jgi:hypothetical protein
MDASADHAATFAHGLQGAPYQADDLMAGDNGDVRIGKFAVHNVKIGPADAARADANAYFVGEGHGQVVRSIPGAGSTPSIPSHAL